MKKVEHRTYVKRITKFRPSYIGIVETIWTQACYNETAMYLLNGEEATPTHRDHQFP